MILAYEGDVPDRRRDARAVRTLGAEYARRVSAQLYAPDCTVVSRFADDDESVARGVQARPCGSPCREASDRTAPVDSSMT
jgi:hypothetical protein